MPATRTRAQNAFRIAPLITINAIEPTTVFHRSKLRRTPLNEDFLADDQLPADSERLARAHEAEASRPGSAFLASIAGLASVLVMAGFL